VQPSDDLLPALVRQATARVLAREPHEIAGDLTFTAQGLDPLRAMRLVRDLGEALSLDLPTTVAYDFPTPDGLAAHLLSRTRLERWELGQGQLVMYRDQRRCPESVAYNLPLLFEIHGEVDEAALERAVRAQAEIHPVLGARFGEHNGIPYLTVAPGRAPSFERLRLTAESRAEQLAALRALVDVPFDLTTGPLVRAHLIALPGPRRLLLITVHHILMDGTSTAILIRTLKEAYRGGRVEPGVPFGDFVAWEKALLADARGARHREHWQRRLAGPRTVLALPCDRPYDPRRLPRVAVLIGRVSPARTSALSALARTHRVSVATVFFAAYVRLLSRLTGQDDLILGMTAAARYEQRFQDVVGQIANCLPVRCADTGDLPRLLKSVQREMVAAIEHGACPLPEIARSLGEDGRPLVLTNFLFQNFEGAALLGDGVRAAPGALDLRPFDDLPYAGEYPLSLEFYRDGEGYKAFLKYDTHLFHESTAQKMLGEWNAVLGEFTTDSSGETDGQSE